MADKIVVMNAGRVEQIGTALELYDRPGDIVIRGGGAIPVDVLVVEPTGSETHVTASLAGHELTIISKKRLSTRPGEQLMVGLCSPRAHAFDTATGARALKL